MPTIPVPYTSSASLENRDSQEEGGPKWDLDLIAKTEETEEARLTKPHPDGNM